MTTVSTRLSDVIVPEEFTGYLVENSMVRTALVESGVMARNSVIADQLAAGSNNFTVPYWGDLGDTEADVVSDDPDVDSTPRKLGTDKQTVRKSYLHGSWSAMNLASELAGSNALVRIQDRATAYWERQMQKRLVNSLSGILADNVANDSGDLVHDISGATNADVSATTKFSAAAVIAATAGLGDAMDNLTSIAVHSDIYRAMLNADLISFIPDSQGRPIRTYRGLAVVVDDGLPFTAAGGALDTDAAPSYTSVLFGRGAVGFGMAAPRIAAGTEIENKPAAGNGGGLQVLHSRLNVAVAPAGFTWADTSVAGDSPTLAELATADNWNRVFDRKQIPMAFLITNG